MDLKDTITLGLAIWGALLSTVLAAREILKDRLRLVLNLETHPYDQSLYLVVTNVSRRPVTVTGVGLQWLVEKDGRREWESVSDHELYALVDETKLFPAVLAEGKRVRVELPEEVYLASGAPEVRKNKLTAVDVEHHVYERVIVLPKLKPPPPKGN